VLDLGNESAARAVSAEGDGALSHPTLSVILPVFRNRGQLPELHRRLISSLEASARSFEILYVEDGGADGSLEWLCELCPHDSRVGVLGLADNTGQHAAILAGLRRARGATVVVMDADLQDPPEAVPRLVSALGGRGAVVFGGRHGGHHSRTREWTGRAFKSLLRLLTGGHLPTGAGTFVAMPRSVSDAVLALTGRSPYLLLRLIRTGAALEAIDIPAQQRQASPSAYTHRARLELGLEVLWETLAWRASELTDRSVPKLPAIEKPARLAGWVATEPGSHPS